MRLSPLYRRAFQLAREMGVGHPERLPLTPRQIMECVWDMEFGRPEDDEADYRTARITFGQNRTHGGKSKFNTHLPRRITRRYRRIQTPAEIKAALDSFC